MLFCFWIIDYCSSLSRFCPWHLICYCKWIFPLPWVLCNNSLPGGYDEWRNVTGGLCLAKRMCGHHLLGTRRYCLISCRYTGLSVPENLVGNHFNPESDNACGLEALCPVTRFAFLSFSGMTLNIFLCRKPPLGPASQMVCLPSISQIAYRLLWVGQFPQKGTVCFSPYTEK